MSDRELEIDVPLVSRLVATQFPQWTDLPIKPLDPGGWDNRSFHLGERMIIRLPSAEAYAAQVKKEHRWLPRLAPFLPLPIPIPLGLGEPALGYPWHWSIHRWLDGETASLERIADLREFAVMLAEFLAALQRIDAAGGPAAGAHNFYRGGSLKTYDSETREAVTALGDRIDVDAVTQVWEAALASTWRHTPVWVHGDVAAGNLLVSGGRLSAVIDFGSSGVGDPACDLSIAWTLFHGKSREAFRATIPLDHATWARARGWTLWKALIVLAELPGTNPLELERSPRVIDDVLADHQACA